MIAVLPKSPWLLAGCLVSALASVASAQPLVPLTDAVEEPLLPTGIMTDDVEMFGVLVYLWRDEHQTDVIHFVGDFELHLGPRRLQAREAVLWMTPRTYEGTSYHAFEVFLRRDARVLEPAGTVTSAPALFVTLNSTGKVRVSADKKTFASSADTVVFQEAAQVRAQLQAAGKAGAAITAPFAVTDTGPLPEAKPPVPRPVVNYRARDLTVQQVEGRRVVTAIGDVYLFRTTPGSEDFLELRADAAAIYLAEEQESPPEQVQPPPANLTERPTGEDVGLGEALTGAAGAEETGREDQGLYRSADIEAVYLEGDIVMTRGERMIRASQLYYDFHNDQAVILDAVFRTYLPERNVPVYVRAERVRQLSSRAYQADHPLITTSEFYTPHYHIGAARIDLEDKTEKELAGLRSGAYKMTHTTFNVGGVPLLYWPYTQGTLKEGETPIRSARAGYSDDFGVELETKWRLFNVLGLETPVGFDATLGLDYFSKRGPGIGLDLDYQRDNYFGLVRGYYIHDTGQDTLPGLFRDNEPDTQNRGRLTFRHRQYLPDDWQLTLEASYISDKNFLEEYFESEFDKGKEQETLFYLKKQRDTWAFTLLGQWRILDSLTQTEHLPDLGFRLLGQPLGDFATLYSENRAGWVRYRAADRNLYDFYRFFQWGPRVDSSGVTGRVDSRQEVDTPLTLGPVKVVPFGAVRGSAWDDSPQDGGLTRVFGSGGVRGSMYLWRLYDTQSDLWDIHGMRHIVKPDFTAWASGSTRTSHELYPFEANVEDIDEIDGVTLGLRQRWQTKRGAPDRQRISDVFLFDVEVGAFNNAQNFERTYGYTSYSRPENSISRNYVDAAGAWRINDTTSLLSEANVDLNDRKLDVFNLSYVVERTPRLSYMIGHRFIGDTDSNLLAAGANYQMTEKHTLAIREEFDLDRGQTAEFSLGVIRKLPRWYMAMTFDLDEIEEDIGVSMSVWPEGFPRTVLGSRRFTGVATSTAISPD
ncbi:MAG: hypothetical protein V2A79_08030 [Planctomycetota bacterium]